MLTSDTMGFLLLAGTSFSVVRGGAVAMVYISELYVCLEHSSDSTIFVDRPGRLGLYMLTLHEEYTDVCGLLCADLLGLVLFR